MRFLRFSLVAAAVVTLSGCSPRSGVPGADPPSSRDNGPPSKSADPALVSAVIRGVPHVSQKPDFCGEAVTESWLKFRGSPVSQDQVFALSGMDPSRGMGATTRELAVALHSLGFEPGTVASQVAANSAVDLEVQFAALHADLVRQIPSIVCMRFDERLDAPEHFRLVLGYDSKAGEVIYHDPAIAQGGYLRMSRSRFLSLWPLKYATQVWTVIRLRLQGNPIAVQSNWEGASPADYAQHVMALREGKARGFNLVVEPPFVVIGDGSQDELRNMANHIVRWTTTRLKLDFFASDPKEILDIWLFGDSDSYEKNTLRLFGSPPSTPFGFYSSEHHSLVMNIDTGGGTLVHEIVHPYIAANFPHSPAWFNEGLGSLFEQSAERDGHIVGQTNWRLAGLQKDIIRKKLPRFKTLLSTTRDQFYERDPGSNYAQSRYLLYYVQEQGLLPKFYHEFLDHQKADTTGLATLKRVLNEPDLDAFQARWEQWVLGLRFGGAN